MNFKNLQWLFTRRFLIVTLLGFASGLPLALVDSTLQARFASAGVPLVTIGFMTLVGQPYIYKFLWAPFLDRFVLPFLGRRRGWMLLTQCCLVMGIAAMALVSESLTPWLLGGLAMMVAFFSATQDIAFDAYRTELLLPEERGLGTAFTVGAYRLAMLVSGGVALILADHFGWRFTYLVMAALMGVGIMATLFADEKLPATLAPRSLREAVLSPLKEFMSRPKAWQILLLIVFYKFGDAFASKLTTVFLLRGMGFSLTEVGTANKLFGFLATLSGIFVGGFLMSRMKLYKALLLFGVLQAFGILLFVWLANSGPSYKLLVTVIFSDYFVSGMGTAAFVALIMSLCNTHYTATQFALLSSLSSIARETLGPFTAALAASVGWSTFYCYAFLAAWPGLILLVCTRNALEQGGAPIELSPEASTA